VVSPHIRTVKTGSGATVVQIMWSKRGGKRDIEHVGSAHGDRELAVPPGAAEEIINRGQGELDLGLGVERRFQVAGSRSARLWRAVEAAYGAVGFGEAVPDRVFKLLTLARIVEPTSKLDSIRVLGELGVQAPSYRTVKRRLRQCVDQGWRSALEDACAAHTDVSHLRFCLYDVITLYWETHEGDWFREPGLSKERRLEPQIAVGLLTTQDGFPLQGFGQASNSPASWRARAPNAWSSRPAPNARRTRRKVSLDGEAMPGPQAPAAASAQSVIAKCGAARPDRAGADGEDVGQGVAHASGISGVGYPLKHAPQHHPPVRPGPGPQVARQGRN
jgi:hypothetical protein